MKRDFTRTLKQDTKENFVSENLLICKGCKILQTVVDSKKMIMNNLVIDWIKFNLTVIELVAAIRC